MPPLKQLKFPPKIPYVKPVLGALALLLVAAFVAPMFVNKEHLQTSLIESLSKASGVPVKLTIQGGISPFPSPHVALSDITIGDDKPILSARTGKLNLGWAGLFSGGKHPAIVLGSPTFNLVEADTSLQPALKQLCAMPGVFTVQNGEVNLQRAGSDAITRVETVNGVLKCEASSLNLSLQGRTSEREATLNITSGLDAGQPLTITLATKDGSHAEFSGTLPAAGGETPGTFSLHTNLSTWIPKVESAKQPEKSNPTQTLDVKGDATLGNGELWLHSADATIGGAKGRISAYGALRGLPTLAVDVQADTFNLTPFTPIVANLLKASRPAADSNEVVKEDYDIIVLAKTTALTLGTRTLKDASANVEYGGIDITLRDISVATEDGSVFTFNGRYTDRALGARIEGKGLLEGKSLKAFLASFEPTATSLPDENLGEYSLASNIFWSNEQFRVSEAAVKLGDINFTGGLSTYFENITRSEAEIRIKGVNLDYFRNAWRKAKQESAGGTYKLSLLNGNEFQWLKRLTGIIDLNVWLDGFTFLDRTGTIGNMHIIAKPGELSLSNIELGLPEGTLRSTVTLNASGPRPRLTLILAAPFFDSAYTKLEGDKPSRPWIDPTNKTSRFSEELFDFSWTDLLDGEFDINIADFKLEDTTYGFFKAKATLKDQQLQIQNFGFNILGGQISMNGNITGGKVPALSCNFALYNIHVEDLLQRFALPSSITGRANVSGNVTTSGINFLEWLKQANMRATVTARGVRVPGFNLQGILETTQAARNTGDVVKGVEQMVSSGTSEFSVDGNINLQQAIFKTPGLGLTTTTQTTGVIGGQIELLPWKMNLDAKFQFPQLGATTMSTFGLNIAGPIEAYTVRTDTASLEAFVAKRIVGQ